MEPKYKEGDIVKTTKTEGWQYIESVTLYDASVCYKIRDTDISVSEEQITELMDALPD